MEASGTDTSRTGLAVAMSGCADNIPQGAQGEGRGADVGLIEQSSNLAKTLCTKRLGDLFKVTKLARQEGKDWDLNPESVAGSRVHVINHYGTW